MAPARPCRYYAYVVIKEPRLIAVFSRARVHILHVGLLGAGFIARRFLARESTRRTESAAGLRPVLRRLPRLGLHGFVTHSYWLVNGDEIRKDCLHTERFERKWTRTNQRLKRAMGEAPL
jgi:hypothetical protein